MYQWVWFVYISWTSGCGLSTEKIGNLAHHILFAQKIEKGSTKVSSFKQDSKHKFQLNVPQELAPNKSLTKWIFQENQYQYFVARDAKQV